MHKRLDIRNAVSLSALVVLALALFGILSPVKAENMPPNTVATVNGIAITYDDIALAEEELRSLLGQLPEQQRFEALVSYMVDQTLAAKAAREAGLEGSPEVQKRMAFMQQKALQDVYIGQLLMEKVTEKAVSDYYQKNIANGPRQQEVRARHILVDSQEEADAVVAVLKNGGDFVQLAKERSKGPSGSSGGDLGYFDRDAMVAPFADAAFRLKKGQISDPVKTQFGWHVIKLEDKRDKPTPPLEEVRNQIYQILISEARREVYDDIREGADVAFVNVAPSSE